MNFKTAPIILIHPVYEVFNGTEGSTTQSISNVIFNLISILQYFQHIC